MNKDFIHNRQIENRQATRSFSSYGAFSSDPKSELNNALNIARNINSKKNRTETISKKQINKSDFIRLGDDAKSYNEIDKKNNIKEANIEVNNENAKKLNDIALARRKHAVPTVKSEETIKKEVEKANEINKKLSSKMDENTPTNEILENVINELF